MPFGQWKFRPKSTALKETMFLTHSLLLGSAMHWAATMMYLSIASFINGCHSQRVATAVCKALNPDGFVTHRGNSTGMYHMEPKPNDDVSRVGPSFRFGKAVKALFDCLVLVESMITKRLGGAPFGQVMRYTQHLFLKGSGSAALLNRTTLLLINSINGVVVRVISAKWVMEGSKALFRDFITKNLLPWVTCLTAACSALNIEVVEGDAFLGRGAFGRVFKVKRVGQDGDVLALKIVETISVGRLFHEEDALVRAQNTGLAIDT
ncbi:unnamed protein product [Phytophthora fragariaefolia]|uniref:Unnamed protein product n=1 Tax=Phytophthora fragariaefolia TaxID=1490495 RepID=A0A9W7CNT5_9STRA|nr:unnamed protein product [Phytophthora fragariaefolia]